VNISGSQKSIIQRVINCFETGRPDGDYGKISVYADGPHDIRQITYGRSQTTEYGNLRRLVQMYVDAGGTYSNALKPYADKVGSAPLVDDAAFKDLLRRAGREDPVMGHIQDEFFDNAYYLPALKWADAAGFSLALSALVIYDSFIHSGSILWTIRQRFSENPPGAGGDEKAWTAAYVHQRHAWLKGHHRAAVRASAYRTADLQKEIKKGNWNLDLLPVVANGKEVYPKAL
jgi:chitosanase